MASDAHTLPETRGLTVLLVDDNAAVRASLAAILRHVGYRVLNASSAEEAMGVVEKEPVDGFVLDVDLGHGMSGIDICRWLRQEDAHKQTPVLFVTGSGEASHAQEVFDAGGDDLISKPFIATVVDARLRRHLERNQYFKEVQRMRHLLEPSGVPGRSEPEFQEVSVCFTHLGGFSALSEELEPATVWTALQCHISDQVESAREFGGSLDRFGGIGLMTTFHGPHHQMHSCLHALTVLDRTRERLKDPQAGVVHSLGMGIHTGRAIVGHLGPRAGGCPTTVGLTAQLATRLGGVAEAMSIIASSDVCEAARANSRLRFHSGREVRVEGHHSPIAVYGVSRAV